MEAEIVAELPLEPETTPLIDEPVETLEVTPPKKVKKPRKPMSAEHKAKLLAGLAKAREASALKRGKKSKAKKILKAQDDKVVDDILDKHIKAKAEKASAKDKEIAELKLQISNLTLQDVVVKKKKLETIPEEEVQPQNLTIEALPVKQSVSKSVPKPMPVKAPVRRSAVIKPKNKRRM